MRKRIRLFLFFCIHVYTVALAQDPVYRSINNLNGLPSNTVYDIAQDVNGFLWICHDKGLSKYDGNTFKNYSTNNQQGRSLSSLVQINQTLWCQDFAGNFFYVKDDSLIKEKNITSPGFYMKIGKYRQEGIYSFYVKKIRYFNISTKQTTITSLNDISYVSNVCFDADTAYISTLTSVQKFVQNRQTTVRKYSFFIPSVFFLQKLKNVFYGFSRSGKTIIYRFDSDKITPLNLLPDNLFIQNIQYINKELWISTSTGAYCFDENMNPKYNGFCFYKSFSISSVNIDRENNYIFGTASKGVLIVPDLNIREYKLSKSFISSLAFNNKQEFIAGTANNTLLKYNTSKAIYKTIYSESTNHEIVFVYNDTIEEISIICSDKITIEKNGKKIQQIDYSGKSVTKVEDGIYAISISNGCILINTKYPSKPFPKWLLVHCTKTSFQNILFFKNAFFRGRSVLCNQQDSIIYSATTDGLYYYSSKGSGIILNQGKKIYATQLQQHEGLVYAATLDEGLLVIKNLQVLQQFSTKNILLSNTIYKMCISDNIAWLAGDAALQRLDLKQKTISSYNNSDGIPKSEIKDIVVQQHQVYLATVDGLVVFNENRPVVNSVSPLLHLNNFYVNQKRITYKPNIIFPSNTNSIEIQFSVLSFKGNNSTTVQYQINNGNWISIDNQNRTLSLPSLASGNYQLVIRAFNEDGVVCKEPIYCSFYIKAPFYKQLWFVIILVLAAMIFVYVYFYFRIKNIEQNNQLISEKLQLEEALQRSMLSAIKSQMNPHFLFNALNTIQSYIYTNDKLNASVYLAKFSDLTRMILEMSNKDIVSLSDEIRSLELYLSLEKIRFEDKLHYKLVIDENISVDTTFIPSMLIQPYVENAIKHGLLHKKNDRNLLLSFVRSENGISVTIDDNGIGRKRSEELQKIKQRKHQSFAVSANQKRLEILNKGLKNNISLMIIDKKTEKGDALGTQVVLHIPFSKQASSVS
ncbi:MAG: sensor histidine kinase [Chitinophagaceae bacterium]